MNKVTKKCSECNDRFGNYCLFWKQMIDDGKTVFTGCITNKKMEVL